MPPRHHNCASYMVASLFFLNTATSQQSQVYVVLLAHQPLDLLWEILER